MGKTKRSDKEYTKEQRLVKENQALKREILSLRKQLARVDISRLDIAKEILEESQDSSRDGQHILERLKQEWKCREPECKGYLEIIIYSKIDQLWYYRKCNDCFNRTKSKKYDKSSVKGIIKNSK